MWAYLGAGLEGLDEIRGELDRRVAVIRMALACCLVGSYPGLVSSEKVANSQFQ